MYLFNLYLINFRKLLLGSAMLFAFLRTAGILRYQMKNFKALNMYSIVSLMLGSAKYWIRYMMIRLLKLKVRNVIS